MSLKEHYKWVTYSMRYLSRRFSSIALGILVLNATQTKASSTWEIISDGTERQGGKSFGQLSHDSSEVLEFSGSLFALPAREPDKRVGFVIAKTNVQNMLPCAITFLRKSAFVPSLYLYASSGKTGLAYVLDLAKLGPKGEDSKTRIDLEEFLPTFRGKPINAPAIEKADIVGFGVGLKRSNQDAFGLRESPLDFSASFVLETCEILH